MADPERTGWALELEGRRLALCGALSAVLAAHGYPGASRERLLHAGELDPDAFDLAFADREGCLLQCNDQAISSARRAIVGAFPPPASSTQSGRGS